MQNQSETIKCYGCVICQDYHYEGDEHFEAHKWRMAKHHGLQAVPVEQWEQRNERNRLMQEEGLSKSEALTEVTRRQRARELVSIGVPLEVL